jgi:DNA-binding response OmpR family regulator
MEKLLIVDDEEPLRRLLRLNLSDAYQIFDTGDPEQALAMAMQNRPDAILLDLRMPKCSGFELCRTFTSLTSTQLIPVFVVTGEAGATTKALCRDLGATAYFEKPIDFAALRSRLAHVLQTKRPERRSEVRVRLRVMLKLKGTDASGEPLEEATFTDNLSLNSFFCGCTAKLKRDSILEVYLLSGGIEQSAGPARIVRRQEENTTYPRYAFRFVNLPAQWVIQ